MNFIMNNRHWTILEKSLDEMQKFMETKEFYFGLTIRDRQEIWLNKDVCDEQKRQTLFHELTHAYITCYICLSEINYSEEMLCDIVGNSHDIIIEIVNDYFRQNF